ncbi:uncharacterized protein LOC132599967 [Lycium barbarum]|uniref:uncharacterized protein LOC132599967 n=1 Tax=Lycium barbarum TaxID=112863 RepID=UPI00293F1C68|nr:uncharacterized protein LOC132599967 [Lycium barbarum]
MSPSVARGALNFQILRINECPLMEEGITEEEQQGEEMSNEPLFPRLEKLKLGYLPKLGHFFLTKCALEFPFLRRVDIRNCPEMKTFIQLGSVSTPNLKYLSVEEWIEDAEMKSDLNIAIQQRFNSKSLLPGTRN